MSFIKKKKKKKKTMINFILTEGKRENLDHCEELVEFIYPTVIF
jgi:hypothetical protein